MGAEARAGRCAASGAVIRERSHSGNRCGLPGPLVTTALQKKWGEAGRCWERKPSTALQRWVLPGEREGPDPVMAAFAANARVELT